MSAAIGQCRHSERSEESLFDVRERSEKWPLRGSFEILHGSILLIAGY